MKHKYTTDKYKYKIMNIRVSCIEQSTIPIYPKRSRGCGGVSIRQGVKTLNLTWRLKIVKNFVLQHVG